MLPTSSKKPTVIAIEEVRRGLVKYSLTGQAPEQCTPVDARSVSKPRFCMKIILGIGGGIAAYKSAELARLLMQQGHEVQAVMTAAAQEFVRPLTFAALTGRKVLTDLFAIESAIEHISVAQEHDLLAIAPATADLMAKMAHGLADDFLTTLYLAFTGPVVLAPAMNVNMWQHPATQANLDTLRRRGHRIVEPDSGYLACGMTGPGRLADPEIIAAAIEAHCRGAAIWKARHVLITAGPTQEPLDPVRYISNRSSGKMGYALAEAAAARGAHVVLISGPVHLPPPRGVEVIARAHRRRNARTGDGAPGARRHRDQSRRGGRFPSRAKSPIRRSKKPPRASRWNWTPRPDILAELGRKKGDRLLIGFAAETQNLAAGSAPQTGIQELRHGGGQPGGRRRDRLRDRRERSHAGRCAPAKPFPCPAPPSAKSPTGFSTRCCKLRLALHATDGR